MLWHGLAAFQDALHLLAVAEAAAKEAAESVGASAASSGVLQTAAGPVRWPLAWRHGMLRPARSAKQARDIAKFLPKDTHAAAATQAEAVTDAAALAALVPGLNPDLLLPAGELPVAAGAQQAPPPAAQRRRQHQQQEAAAGPPALGLMVNAAATIHPASYMRALWLACQAAAAGGAAGSAATLALRPVLSLRQLQAAEGPFDAVVVAAGAAVGSIEELRGRLPLDLCLGHSLDVSPGSSSGAGASSTGRGESAGGSGSGSYPAGAPSLLGSPYIAAHGEVSLVVGATKRYGLSWQEAYRQLSTPVVQDAVEAEAAAATLLPGASQLWPPLAGWRVAAVRAGVRALPLRGSDGSIPYAGRVPLEAASSDHTDGGGCDSAGSGGGTAGSRLSGLPEDGSSQDAAGCGTAGAGAAADGGPLPPCWVVGGLGARGLVYHAWLGRLVAAAVLADSEEGLPAELLRWREAAPASEEAH